MRVAAQDDAHFQLRRRTSELLGFEQLERPIGGERVEVDRPDGDVPPAPLDDVAPGRHREGDELIQDRLVDTPLPEPAGKPVEPFAAVLAVEGEIRLDDVY